MVMPRHISRHKFTVYRKMRARLFACQVLVLALLLASCDSSIDLTRTSIVDGTLSSENANLVWADGLPGGVQP